MTQVQINPCTNTRIRPQRSSPPIRTRLLVSVATLFSVNQLIPPKEALSV